MVGDDVYACGRDQWRVKLGQEVCDECRADQGYLYLCCVCLFVDYGLCYIALCGGIWNQVRSCGQEYTELHQKVQKNYACVVCHC